MNPRFERAEKSINMHQCIGMILLIYIPIIIIGCNSSYQTYNLELKSLTVQMQIPAYLHEYRIDSMLFFHKELWIEQLEKGDLAANHPDSEFPYIYIDYQYKPERFSSREEAIERAEEIYREIGANVTFVFDYEMSANLSMERWQKTYNDFTLLSRDTIQVAGLPAEQIVYSTTYTYSEENGTSSSYEVIRRVAFFEYGDLIFKIESHSLKVLSDRVEKEFNYLLTTIKFIE